MRVAILGGGSAGFMAAAHLTRHFPSFERVHIYDHAIPPIGVGEGTTPPFRNWIHDTTGLSFDALQEQCLMTRKEGIVFENWGRRHSVFTHYFSPAVEGNAYHISAARLIPTLQACVDATTIDANVARVVHDGRQAQIMLGDGTVIEADFVVDARGFPSRLDDSHRVLPGIPTNAAIVRRGPPCLEPPATRAVARPHGWVFVIPLVDSTAYGYVYNAGLSTAEAVRADFDVLLGEEGVVPISPQEKHVQFPNYAHRDLFDGVVFRIGNAASFIEPLEATALGVIILQLQFVTSWLIDRSIGLSEKAGRDDAIQTINTFFRMYLRRLSLFVSWHYAEGSRFDTPFWTSAIAGYRQAASTFEADEAGCVGTEFERFAGKASGYPPEMAQVHRAEALRAIESTVAEASRKNYGGFLVDSFAKVGHGLGVFFP
jgi:tryptophan halogenase